MKAAGSTNARLELLDVTTRDMVMEYVKAHRTLTIPAGTNCAEIVVRPRHDPAVTNDVSITITIDPGSCHSDNGPATVTIYDNGGQVERGFSVIMR